MSKKYVLLSFLCACFLACGYPVMAQDSVCQCQCACSGQPVATETNICLPNDNTSTETDPDDPVPDETTNDDLEIPASPIKIFISEVISDPSADLAEGVELYNPMPIAIDLTDYYLLEGSNSKTKLTGQIQSHEYIFVAKSGLNNSGDIVKLFNSTEELLDQVSFGNWDDGDINDNAPLIIKGESIIRRDVNVDYDIDFQDFFLTLTPTPNEENLFTEKIVVSPDSSTSTQSPVTETTTTIDEPVNNNPTQPTSMLKTIKITELLPNPTGSDTGNEFIEIFNYGTETIDLTGWKIDDEIGGSTPFTIKNGTIAAGALAVYYNSETKLTLNNDADSVRLIALDESVVDQVDYTTVKEGQSYSYVDNAWQWTTNLTPGAENQVLVSLENNNTVLKSIVSSLVNTASAKDVDLPVVNKKTTDKNKMSLVSIEDLINFSKGDRVQISGVVTVPPNVYSSTAFYLQEGESAVEVQCRDEELLKNITPGQNLKLSAYVLSQENGLRQISMHKNDQLLVENQGEPLQPAEITVADLTENSNGQLVILNGEVVDKVGGRIIFQDDTGEIDIALKKSTGLKSSSFTSGDQLKISGIAQFTGTKWQILPRSVDDLMMVPKEVSVDSTIKEPVAQSAKINWIWIIAINLGVLAAFRLAEKREIFALAKNKLSSLVSLLRRKVKAVDN